MGAAICMKLSCLYMYARARMCAIACTHVHGAPPKHSDSPTPIHPPPSPQRGGPLESVKIQ